MRTKITFLLFLISGWCFAQSVPNTNTFSLQDVVSVVGGTSLDQAFTNSNATYFDATYGSKTMSPKTLYGFRNYTVSGGCPVVGDSYGGGVVAYVFVSGDPGYVSGECHGIIATATDIVDDLWYIDQSVNVGTTLTALGSGYDNTNEVFAVNGDAENYAVRTCYYHSEGGYTDWFLPSLDELAKLYYNKTAIGGFTNSAYYWSSSEYSTTSAWAIKFDAGSTMRLKDTTGKVRAIRYF
jgi:hypothetical protein